MTEQDFKKLASFASLAGGGYAPELQEYLSGYLRGLRRGYHGADFGSQEQHSRWLAEDGHAGLGYLDGYYRVTAWDAAPEADVFRDYMRRNSMSAEDVALICGNTRRAAQYWIANRRAIPLSCWRLLLVRRMVFL